MVPQVRPDLCQRVAPQVSSIRETGGISTKCSSKSTDSLRYLWRAVDQDGDVLDILVQRHRDKKAAKKFFRKLLKGIAVCLECDHYRQAKELRRGEG